jgi:hypothetical protein
MRLRSGPATSPFACSPTVEEIRAIVRLVARAREAAATVTPFTDRAVLRTFEAVAMLRFVMAVDGTSRPHHRPADRSSSPSEGGGRTAGIERTSESIRTSGIAQDLKDQADLRMFSASEDTGVRINPSVLP